MIRAAITILVLAAATATSAALASPGRWQPIEFGLEHPCTGDLIDVTGEQFVIERRNKDGEIVASHSIVRASGRGEVLAYEIDQHVTNNPLVVTGATSFISLSHLSIRASNGNTYRSFFVARYTRESDGTLSVDVLVSYATPCD